MKIAPAAANRPPRRGNNRVKRAKDRTALVRRGGGPLRGAMENRFFTVKEQALILGLSIALIAGAVCLIRLGKPVSPPAAQGRASGSPRLDLNTASAEQLESLPGIGPKLAARIIEYRKAAPFRSVDDLKRVPGLGEKKVEAIRRLVTVSSP